MEQNSTMINALDQPGPHYLVNLAPGQVGEPFTIILDRKAFSKSDVIVSSHWNGIVTYEVKGPWWRRLLRWLHILEKPKEPNYEYKIKLLQEPEGAKL